MSTLTDPDTAQRPAREAGALAQEMAEARRELVEHYERHHGLTPAEALAKVREYESAEYAEQLLQQPVRDTSWTDLDTIAAVDPEAAAGRWERVIDEARADLVSGHRAAGVLEVSQNTCWSRAEFLGLRDHLAEEWEPRNGIELTLIDALAQSHTLKMFWLQRMLALDALEQSSGTESKLQPSRATTFQCVEQAAAMADRFDRQFMRALRSLRDLRRYMPQIVVQHAETVNVAEQQLNVSRDKK